MPSTEFDYETLAEFRYQIRRFLRFSEEAARAQSLSSQQHQLLLALKGLPRDLKPTVGVLAERLQLRHHSAVELVDRLVDRGYAARTRDSADRRLVLVHVTPRGMAALDNLTRVHRAELHTSGPRLIATLRKLVS
jgi:DNA-binding MarR family transcriptional regulator